MPEYDMWQRFTNPATRVIHFAQEEAKRMGVNIVGTEHILLGLVREGEGVAACVLSRLGVSLGRVRLELVRQVGIAESPAARQTRLTLSPKAKQALEYALQEAQELNAKLGLRDYVDTEHILLGLTREGVSSGSKAMRLLEGLGVDPEQVRHEVMRYLGEPQQDAESCLFDSRIQGRLTGPARATLRLAQAEARRGGCGEAGAEHLLIAFLREGEGIAARVLGWMGVTPGRLRASLAQPSEQEDGSAVKLGPAVECALHYAADESEDFHIKYSRPLVIDTEHLLLGLLRVGRDEGNTALDLLEQLDIDPLRIRQQVLEALGLVAGVKLEEEPAPQREPTDVWLSFTEAAFRIIRLAQKEADRQGTNVIGLPHLALGLFRFNEAALARQGVTFEQVRIALKTDPEQAAAAPSLSPQCADTLGFAYQAALKATPTGALVRIEPAHLVQGLAEAARTFDSPILKQLDELGIDLERVKAEL